MTLRQQIIELLKEESLTCNAIAKRLGKAKSSVKYVLLKLYVQGIVGIREVWHGRTLYKIFYLKQWKGEEASHSNTTIY